jgi:hypothetical protein
LLKVASVIVLVHEPCVDGLAGSPGLEVHSMELMRIDGSDKSEKGKAARRCAFSEISTE